MGINEIRVVVNYYEIRVLEGKLIGELKVGQMNVDK